MDKLSLSEARISEVMTKDLVVVSLGCTVGDAVEKMVDYAVECLPVIDADGALHGLITFMDVVMRARRKRNDEITTWFDLDKTSPQPTNTRATNGFYSLVLLAC